MKLWELNECLEARWDQISCLSFNGQPLDLCMDAFGFVSLHDYSYSMGIGDAWSVHVIDLDLAGEVIRYGGSIYNYGIGKPHYPVPAIR